MLKYKIKSNYYSNATDIYLDAEMEKSIKLQEQEIEKKLKSNNIVGIKRKLIISGSIVEVEIFPVWDTKNTNRGKKSGPTKAEQRAVNTRNAIKRVVRLINANFTEKDMWITVGYKGGTEPDSYERCKKDIKNYIERLRTVCRNNSWEDIKYIYTIEKHKNGKYHAHIVMNFPDRDMAEKKWGHGKYPQARRLKPDDFGLEGMAKYIAKNIEDKMSLDADEEGIRRNSYGWSLNLKKPVIHESYTAIKKKKVEKIAKDESLREEYFNTHRDYKKYKYLTSQVTYSPYTDGCYIYAKFKRKE